jgi:UDP-glucose 4-epimerase
MNYRKQIKNKVILITGGTGSFGNALTDRLLPLKPKEIVIFSRDEKKQSDMRNKYNTKLLHFIIGDVRDRQGVDDAMVGVDYVFHAAALKQVPACEFFPLEAVKTNILGGNNVIQSAIEHKVKRVVILSTDKAVYPINAMGMTKAIVEKIMVAYSGNPDTILCGVRYGNVLYSRGSVIPYFVDSIKKGEPLKVTNPKMTRFLLPLDTAVDLVLETLVHGKRGKMYVRKSPACTIETLAQAVCEIFDYKKGYIVVGPRMGEKTHETLVPSEETPFTSENTIRFDVAQTKELLLKIPEVQKERKDYGKS